MEGMFRWGLVKDPRTGEVRKCCGQCAEALVSSHGVVTPTVMEVDIVSKTGDLHGRHLVFVPLPGVDFDEMRRTTGHGTDH